GPLYLTAFRHDALPISFRSRNRVSLATCRAWRSCALVPTGGHERRCTQGSITQRVRRCSLVRTRPRLPERVGPDTRQPGTLRVRDSLSRTRSEASVVLRRCRRSSLLQQLRQASQVGGRLEVSRVSFSPCGTVTELRLAPAGPRFTRLEVEPAPLRSVIGTVRAGCSCASSRGSSPACPSA